VEFCIPKEFQEKYRLTEPTNLMLVPRENHFEVMKLKIAGPNGEIK